MWISCWLSSWDSWREKLSAAHSKVGKKEPGKAEKEPGPGIYRLKIPFERVDTDEAVTMDDCVLIDQKLNMKMVKTLFLCNRKKTIFYLFITTGEKAFDTKNFSNALGISRVSFGPAETMEEMLGNKIGAATVFGTLLDLDGDVQVIVDKEVADEEYYGCSDGTTSCYMKIKTEDIIDRFLPFAKHKPVIAEI